MYFKRLNIFIMKKLIAIAALSIMLFSCGGAQDEVVPEIKAKPAPTDLNGGSSGGNGDPTCC